MASLSLCAVLCAVKGWLRKGHCLLMTKACSKAAEAFRRALELDEANEEAREGLHRALSAEASDPEAARKRALDDPEVQAILADPAMQLILQQMQSNPAALREYVRSATITCFSLPTPLSHSRVVAPAYYRPSPNVLSA